MACLTLLCILYCTAETATKGKKINTTKQDLINDVAKVTGLTQADTKIAIEEFLRTVNDLMCGGNSIEIRGFGTFYSKKRKPRPARNPKTGEVVPLHERFVPLFKFSADLKRRVEVGSMAQAQAAAAPSATQSV